jgi:glycosyltransferase involved in cell wall biosynthesis
VVWGDAPAGERIDAYPLRLLHITEALGGGTESAIRGFVQATSGDEHHLLYRNRESSSLGAGFDDFATASAVRSGLLGLRRAAEARVRALQPDIVHLHSSWAGLLGRATGGIFSRSAIVYSPHCFYFERTDVGRVRRSLAMSAERALASRTDVLVATSPYEEDLARNLGVESTFFIRNLLRDAAPRQSERPDGPPLIATVGRVSPQKDPDFLVEVVARMRDSGSDAEWVWIGGGEARSMDRLRRHGVEVTGWLPREQARAHLARASAYVHTAAWESGPVSIEEARLAGIPTVLRSIPPLVSLGFPAGIDTPDDVARELVRVLNGGAPTPTDIPAARERLTLELADQAAKLRAAYLTARSRAGSRIPARQGASR